jgi:predicted RNA binding protein YcfA (HicA-like mRNA interferase family)
MKLPRDLSVRDFVQALGSFGYKITRQSGSHLRFTTDELGEHHITIPNHDPLRIGTLAAIPNDVANHHQFSRDELLTKLFGQ